VLELLLLAKKVLMISFSADAGKGNNSTIPATSPDSKEPSDS
jgi:hypothetical protein